MTMLTLRIPALIFGANMVKEQHKSFQGLEKRANYNSSSPKYQLIELNCSWIHNN